MGPRVSKNILEIQQIESGTLAKFWSDGRNVAKVIANFVQPFCQKQALATLPQNIWKNCTFRTFFGEITRLADHFLETF